MYEEFGGLETCRKISTEFYARVAQNPILRPFFGKTFTCAIESFAAFLVQFLDGPSEHSQRRWWLSLYESHQRFHLDAEHRNAWLAEMTRTLNEIAIPQHHRQAFQAVFETASAYLIDQPNDQPIPILANHWERQLQLDQAVAAIRARSPKSLILIEEFKQTPAIFASLLTLLIRAGQALDYVAASLDSTLAQIPHSMERTLLQEAAAAGLPDLVTRLLELKANPNVLHSLANECRKTHAGARIVRLLVAAGADVNSQLNHQRTTPLHLAARQGAVEIALALIDAGASINLRDRNGDTPLQRALNCKRPKVAAILRDHHASL